MPFTMGSMGVIQPKNSVAICLRRLPEITNSFEEKGGIFCTYGRDGIFSGMAETVESSFADYGQP